MRTLAEFAHDETGQDIVEYSLILAFLTLASAALYVHNTEAIAKIWTNADNTLKLGIPH